MPTWVVITITAAATWVASVVVRMFTSREKKIGRALDHLYPATDSQFPRSMAGLLPPAIVGGNAVTTLVELTHLARVLQRAAPVRALVPGQHSLLHHRAVPGAVPGLRIGKGEGRLLGPV